MKALWMSGAAAVMAISIASVGAQTPQTQPPTQPPATQPPATPPPTAAPQTASPTIAPGQNMASTTVQGCVYKEAAVPGRTPNVAEQAGVLEDYILVASADANATAGTSGTMPPATNPPTTTPPTGTAGTAGSMTPATKAYKLEKIADEQLRAVVGKRVEVTGRVDAERGDMNRTAGAATGTAGSATGTAAPDKNLGPDQIELPEFEVTSIREVEGTCPATPNIKR